MTTVKAVGGVVAVLASIMVVVAILMYPAGDAAPGPASTVTGAHYTKPNYFGCLSKDDFHFLASLFVQRDLNAAGEFMFLHNCIPFPENRKVYIMDTAFEGLMKIRFEGETEAWWTNVEAVAY